MIRVIADIYQLGKPFFKLEPWKAYPIGILILVMSVVTIYFEVLYNSWRGRFYDALQALQVTTFWHEIVYFTILALSDVMVLALLAYVLRRYGQMWRASVTEYYLKLWSLHKNKGDIENPDQRLQEDLRIFARQVSAFTSGGFNAIGMIIVFTPILWQLSKVAPAFGVVYPGSLAVIALLWAIGGSVGCFWVGRRIPHLDYANQRAEANFRFDLVQLRIKDVVSEAPETSISLVRTVTDTYTILFNYFLRFDIASKLYFQSGVIVPMLIVGNGYFSKAITLGILMQVSNAFGRMTDSMTYLLTNYLDIAELQSVILRLKEFKASVEKS